MLYRRGCFRMNAASCTSLGRLDLGNAPGSIPNEAKRVLDQGCMWQSSLACAILKVGFGDSRPVFPDVAQAQALQRSCDGGSARDCAASAVFDVAQGNKVMAMPKLDRACTMGDAFACESRRRSTDRRPRGPRGPASRVPSEGARGAGPPPFRGEAYSSADAGAFFEARNAAISSGVGLRPKT
jgi:hypothetical protein